MVRCNLRVLLFYFCRFSLSFLFRLFSQITGYHIKYIPVPIVTSLLLSYQPPQFLVTQTSLLFAGEPADYSLV